MMEANETGGEARQTPARRRLFRSFFTKKLERKFEEKGLEVPQQLLNIMDVPFEAFTPEDRDLYESKIKPLAFVFAEHLMEVYESMGKPRRGWEEMLDRLEPSPIKVLAALVLHEDEKAESLLEEPDHMEAPPDNGRRVEKISVRVYREKGPSRERWWEKKIF